MPFRRKQEPSPFDLSDPRLNLRFNVYEALFVIRHYWHWHALSEGVGENTRLVLMCLTPGNLSYTSTDYRTACITDIDLYFVTSDPAYWYEWLVFVADQKGLVEVNEKLVGQAHERPKADWRAIELCPIEIYQVMTLFLGRMIDRFCFTDLCRPLHKLKLNLYGITTIKQQWQFWLDSAEYADQHYRFPVPLPGPTEA